MPELAEEDKISTVDRNKPIIYKIEVKSPNTDYVWKELPNTFSDEKEASSFKSSNSKTDDRDHQRT